MLPIIEIENKLHEARLSLLNNHIEESLSVFIDVLDELEKHKNECEGEELNWTTSCFNRTLEEFNLIRNSHPDIRIEVMKSDEVNIATETIPTTKSNEFCRSVQAFSKKTIDSMKNYNDKHQISSTLSKAGKSVTKHVKNSYYNSINYCKEHHVVEKSVTFMKSAACYVYKGVVYVTSSITKGVKELIEKYSTPAPVYTGPPAPVTTSTDNNNVVNVSEQIVPTENVTYSMPIATSGKNTL